MAARILDGTKVAAEIRAEVAAEVKKLADAGTRPGLAVVLVGTNPASEIYVRGKVKSSERRVAFPLFCTRESHRFLFGNLRWRIKS